MKKLIVVESPSKIKTISKILGPEYRIVSTLGHIIDLPPKKIGVEIDPKNINIEYVPIKDKDLVIADIVKASKSAHTIYLAPDPDREGEIIAWHTFNEIEKNNKKKDIYRIAFNEITAPAIRAALENPGTIDMDKVRAQQARRVLDRWVGYEVSPILWKKIAPGLSAGRVQSVALRLIVDREDELRNFNTEEYWSVEGLFGHKKENFSAALTHIGKKKAELKDKKQTDAVVKDLKKESYEVKKLEEKTRKKNPLPPFMTSTLQQAAYNRLGFSVKKTMQVAQKLYEGVSLGDPNSPVALITYMRTDSLRLSDTALKATRGYISRNFSKEYLPTAANVYGKKSKTKAQDAHEAIRPVDVSISPQSIKQHVTPDQAKLYMLIWQRTVASQMKAALYAQRGVTIEGGKYTFKATGSTLLFDGFLKVYDIKEDDKDKVKIPKDLQEKAPLSLEKINPKQHFTQPPPRYTEASLVKELEKEGIGRPSTYATIMSTIQTRDYTKLDEKKRFVPSELGMAVTRLLVHHLPHIMDKKFTAHMEEDLDKIADGNLERDTLLRDFYKSFQEDLERFKGTDDSGKKAAVPTGLECPKCKKNNLNIRFGKSGEFLGCADYPECKFTSNFERTEEGEIKIIKTEEPKIIKEKCPQCGENLRVIVGKFGEFTACTGYPKCKFIKREIASFACPLDKGEVVRKVWRGGKFWGCGNYPKCKFAVFDEIKEQKCPECSVPFLIQKVSKDGKVTLLCFDKKCGYKK